MSKKNGTQHKHGLDAIERDGQMVYYFNFSGGQRYQLKLAAINGIQNIYNRPGKPEVPTYGVETAIPDEVVELPHTEDTLKTEDDHQAWDTYQESLSDFNKATGRIMIRYFAIKVIPADDEAIAAWLEEHEVIYGSPSTQSEVENRIQWVSEELFVSPEDFTELFTAVMEMHGVKQEDIDATRESFRSKLQRDTPETEGKTG